MTKYINIDPDMMHKAHGLYETLKGLTDGPREAMSILLIMHLNLWVNYRDDNITVDTMLDNYQADFRHNLEINHEPTTVVQ